MLELFIKWRLKTAIKNNNLKNLNWWVSILGGGTGTLKDENWSTYGSIDYSSLINECVNDTKKPGARKFQQQDTLLALYNLYTNLYLIENKQAAVKKVKSEKVDFDFDTLSEPKGWFAARIKSFLSFFSHKIRQTKRLPSTEIKKSVDTKSSDNNAEKIISPALFKPDQAMQTLFSPPKQWNYKALNNFPQFSGGESETEIEIMLNQDQVTEQNQVTQMQTNVVEETDLERIRKSHFKAEAFITVTVEEINNHFKNLKKTDSYNAYGWIYGLIHGVKSRYNYHDPDDKTSMHRYPFEISTTAWNEMINSNDALDYNYHSCVDIENLPAGFFWIWPEEGSEGVLKLHYSEEKRLEDLRNASMDGKPIVDLKTQGKTHLVENNFLSPEEKLLSRLTDSLTIGNTDHLGEKPITKNTTFDHNFSCLTAIKEKHGDDVFENWDVFNYFEPQNTIKNVSDNEKIIEEQKVLFNFLKLASDGCDTSSFKKLCSLLSRLQKYKVSRVLSRSVFFLNALLPAFFREINALDSVIFDKNFFILLEKLESLGDKKLIFFMRFCENSGGCCNSNQFKYMVEKYLSLISFLEKNLGNIDWTQIERSIFSQIYVKKNGKNTPPDLFYMVNLTNFLYGLDNPETIKSVIRNLNRLPIDLNFSSNLIQAGYGFVDKDMLQQHGNLDFLVMFDTANFNGNFVTTDILKKMIHNLNEASYNKLGLKDKHDPLESWISGLDESKREVYKKAIFLRYLAFNTTFSHEEALALFVKDGEDYMPTLEEVLEKAGKKLKLNTNLVIGPKNTIDSKKAALRYDDKNEIERVFNTLGNNWDSSKKGDEISKFEKFIENFQDKINSKNQESGFQYLEAANLQNELKNVKTKEHKDFAEVLALLVEAYRRLNKIELRLEQIMEIYFAYHYPSLNQIHTSEGKTLIIGMTAICRAILTGEKVDVITNNDYMAKDNAQKMQQLAQLCGISINHADNGYDTKCDIFYTSIDKHVGNYLQAKALSENGTMATAERKATTVLVDEVDHDFINFEADTTVQIGETRNLDEENKKHYHQFLGLVLAHVDDTVEILQTAIKSQAIPSQDGGYYGQDLNTWLQSAKLAATKQKDIDYVIKKTEAHELPAVVLVHHSTSGRLDERSQWSKGVQALVAYEQQQQGQNIHIPEPSRVIASAMVYESLAQYTHRVGYSGTLGSQSFIGTMQKYISNSEDALVLKWPRAKREFPDIKPGEQLLVENGGSPQWPRRVKQINGKDESEIEYSRRFDFMPSYFKDLESQFGCIMQAIQAAKEQNLSILLFFKTIKACECVKDFLLANDIEMDNVQIYDDNHSENDPLRPTEAEIIKKAKDPGKITIATAAGSRGTDFDGVDVVIIAELGLDTVVEQQQSRIGRNGELGATYQFYCQPKIPVAEGGPVTAILHQAETFERKFTKDDIKPTCFNSDTQKNLGDAYVERVENRIK